MSPLRLRQRRDFQICHARLLRHDRSMPGDGRRVSKR
jgi:hypothetical protein